MTGDEQNFGCFYKCKSQNLPLELDSLGSEGNNSLQVIVVSMVPWASSPPWVDACAAAQTPGWEHIELRRGEFEDWDFPE